MSTAEAELMEAVEGFALGEAVDTLLAEHEGEYSKRLWIDNAAAASVLSLGPCTWRTRHLRIRAHHVLWRLASTDWLVNYLPGRFQVADLGTNSLPLQRMQELKDLLGLGSPKEDDECAAKKVARASIMVLGAGLLKGMDEDDAAHQGSDTILAMFLVLYTALIIILTLVAHSLARKVFSGEGDRSRSRDGPSSSDDLPGVWGDRGEPDRRGEGGCRAGEAGDHAALRRRREGGPRAADAEDHGEGLRRRRASTETEDEPGLDLSGRRRLVQPVGEDGGEWDENDGEVLGDEVPGEPVSSGIPTAETGTTVVFNVFGGDARPVIGGRPRWPRLILRSDLLLAFLGICRRCCMSLSREPSTTPSKTVEHCRRLRLLKGMMCASAVWTTTEELGVDERYTLTVGVVSITS